MAATDATVRRVSGGRVAFFDNTVNTAYIAVKMLRRAGYAVDLIQPRRVPFNQQPFWEDVDVAVPFNVDLDGRDANYWEALSASTGWSPPAWLRRPPAPGPADAIEVARSTATAARATPTVLVPVAVPVVATIAPIVRALRRYDLVIVQGPSAVAAFLAGRPYVVMTAGWDIRTLPFLTGARNPVHRVRAWLQRAALAKAAPLLSLFPAHDAEHIRRLRLERITRAFPGPVDVDDYEAIPPGRADDVFGEEIAARMRGRFTVLAPARVEFGIKGTDRLLRGFAALVRDRRDALLILVRWGRDVTLAERLITDLGIADDVAWLDVVMSKRRLIRAFASVDAVADQFVLTAYGAIARDALAVGRPVVSSYDPRDPQPHPADDPAPILSASTPEAIAAALTRLRDDETRAAIGHASRAWVARVHGDGSLRGFAEILAAHGITPRAGQPGERRERA